MILDVILMSKSTALLDNTLKPCCYSVVITEVPMRTTLDQLGALLHQVGPCYSHGHVAYIVQEM